MKSKINKKGFTLAELLIVVAIIAILIAVALPIFTDSLDNAKLTVEDANVRAIKSIAIAEILSNPEGHSLAKDTDGWVVMATIDANNKISDYIMISPGSYTAFVSEAIDPSRNKSDWRIISDFTAVEKYASGDILVYLFLKPLDLESPSTGG